MLIYRYLPAEFALLAIQEQRLKVGRINNLNDVFDCWPRIIPNKGMDPDEAYRIAEKVMGVFSHVWGSLSYCATAENLLVWSHYGDGHRGIALGFDIDALRKEDGEKEASMIYPIEYVGSRKKQKRPPSQSSAYRKLYLERNMAAPLYRVRFLKAFLQRAEIGPMSKNIANLSHWNGVISRE